MSISANAQITLINMSEAYTVLLTNESQQFSTNSSRVPLSNVSYYTDIVVYQGSTERTDYTIGTVSSSNNITVSQTASRVTFTVSTSSTISSDSGTFTIPITIDGQTFNKIFSWSCAKQGATGSSATSYKMIVSHAAIVQDESGTYSPDSITLTGKSQTGASSMASYSARFKIFLNGSTTASYTSSANESSVTYTIPDGTTSVRCVMYKAGGTSTILDEQTIPVVSDGVSITSVTNKYAVSSSNSTAPTTWYNAVQTMTSTNRYLWSYEIITYSNGNTSETDKRVIGVYGNTGATGNGISNITEYYLASSASSGVTTSTSGWATTIQTTTTTNKYLWNYEVVTYTNGDTYTSTPVIIGTHGAKGSAGTGYTVVLSNESHTFAGGTSTAVATTTSTSVIAYKNTSQIAATITKIGSTSVSGNAAGIATGITGLTASVTNNGTTSCSITFSAITSLTTKSGTIAITLTVDGKTFTKNFSFSLALTGATGTAAKSVDITASSQVFKSTDGGTTFSPDTIKLTPVFQGGISYSKWQYSTNGGSSWTDVSSGSHGLTISSGVLTIAKTSDLYTSSVTSISFKCISNNTSYYDTITVLKLYDVTGLQDDLEDLQNQITTITDTISGVESKVDANTKSITDKIWQSDISTSINEYDGSTVKTIRDRVTSTEKDISGMKLNLSDVQTTLISKADGSTVQELTEYVANFESNYNGFKTTVSETYATKDEMGESVSNISSQYTQLADKFNWVVKSGTSSSDFTITDRLISLTSSALNIDALTTFKNSAENGTSTVINGGAIKANTITTSKLATDAIKSTNYSYSSGNFSSSGTFLDLSTGLVRSKNFAIDSSGNAYFKGNIQANAGYIGGTSGWAITTNTITGNANSKIISGILESSNYVENSTGVQVNLNTGIIKGNIEASTLAAKEAIKIYVGSTKRNVITGHLANDFFYVRIGCDLSTSDIARVKPSIILNKSTASTNVSDMITINTSVLDIEANTSIVGSLSASDISTYTNGGTWISGKRSAAINILTSQSEGAFHPVLRISSYSGNVWCLGGLGDTVGIYGYYSGRTANGYDWCTTWDTSNGNLTTTNDISCNDIMTRTGWAADRLSHGQTAYSNLMSGRISFKWVQNSSGVWRIYVYVDGALVRDW